MEPFFIKIKKNKHQYILFLLVFMTILVISSCNQNEESLKSFYFPFEKLEKGMVYEYVSLEPDKYPTEYWVHYSKKVDNHYHLRSVNIDLTGRKNQEVLEKELSNGMKTIEYNVFSYDSTGRQMTVPLDISQPASFSFAIKDTGNIFVFKANIEDPLDTNIVTTIIKNKTFGGFGSYEYEGIKYPSMDIHLTELVEQLKKGDGYLEPPAFKGIETYAKGIGLVYYKKDISKNFKMEYKLKKIYTKEEFDQK